MHRIYLFAATMLLGIASFSVAALAMSMPREHAQDSVSTPREETVRRFYEAVNLQIRTGDSSALLEVLHPDFIDQNVLPGIVPGPDGLVEYVDTLHVNAAAAQIAVDTIVGSDDEVMAVVDVEWTEERLALGTSFETPTSIWNPVERFRIAEDRIIERNSPNHDLVILKEMLDLPIALNADLAQGLSATQLTFEESGSGRFWTAAGPAILHVLTGELAIRVSTTGSTPQLHPGTVGNSVLSNTRALLPGEVTLMEQGSSLTIPADVGFSAISSEGPTSALYISATQASPLGQGAPAGPHESGGVEIRQLGWIAHDPSFAASTNTTLSRVSLMPGASVSRTSEPSAIQSLMWLDTGTLLTELVRPSVNGSGIINTSRQFVSGVRLSPDSGLAYIWSPGATLHNTTSEPAVLWSLQIESYTNVNEAG